MKTIAFTGGGTLGHLYPALAVIEALKIEKPSTRIIYISTPKEVEILSNHPDIDAVYQVELQGFKRKPSFENIQLIFKLINTIKRVKKILKKEKVDLVVGMGGYLSGAVVFASHRVRVPSLIHEQNACLGMANRFSMRYAKRTMMSFPILLNTKKVIFTGHPRKDEIESKYHKKESNDHKILITSGSGGAQVVNDVAIQFLKDNRSLKYNVTLVTGIKYYKEVLDNLEGDYDHFQVVPFIKDLPRAMNEVDLVITRAGATTIFEILGLKKPAIYIPSPNVVGNHQEKNASYLRDYQLGEVILEKELTKEILFETIENIFNDVTYQERIEKNMEKFIKTNAQAKIVEEIKKWW